MPGDPHSGSKVSKAPDREIGNPPSQAFRHGYSFYRLFLFVFFLFFYRLDATIMRRLRLRVFHGLPGFGDFLGAGFGALLALFVQHLLAAQQLEEGLVCAVTFVPARADDAKVPTVAVAKARTDGIEQLYHR